MARQEQAQPAISTADTGTAEQGLAPGAAQVVSGAAQVVRQCPGTGGADLAK